jgi:hypothetical protein
MIYIEEHGDALLFNRLNSREIGNPYIVVNNYFHQASLATHRRDVHNMLVASVQDRPCNDISPRDLIYIFDELEKLTEAAYLLQCDDGKLEVNPSIIPEGEIRKNVIDLNLYCGWQSSVAPWSYFPRTLSRDEFLNPYKALRKFFKHQNLAGWRGIMKQISECALSDMSLYETEPEFNILKVSTLLQKAIEACHLVDVREIIEIDGRRLPKFKPAMTTGADAAEHPDQEITPNSFTHDKNGIHTQNTRGACTRCQNFRKNDPAERG